MSNKKVLAIASAGGHWKELMLLNDAFNECELRYISTKGGFSKVDIGSQTYLINDSNKKQKLAIAISTLQILKIFLTYKPDIVISTGASPGAIAIIIGNILNKKTIWIDSVANSEELSLGGKIARKYATKTLTQWPHLADEESVLYKGSVF